MQGLKLDRLLPPPWEAAPHAPMPALQTAPGRSRPGSSLSPRDRMGLGGPRSAEGDGASYPHSARCTDLPQLLLTLSQGQRGSPPKALFPGSGTTGSSFFSALGRPASSHDGTAHCCSQTAAQSRGPTQTSRGLGNEPWPGLSPHPGGRESGLSLLLTQLQGHSLHPRAFNVVRGRASSQIARAAHLVSSNTAPP
uniref:Uncharacterized protein n=1 Tax=Molossus molossus TaxID=27622 RepID=A0A7J8GRG6_MOLMO|nr:hypothetical protein HJG59_011257 [Molossus molossus]